MLILKRNLFFSIYATIAKVSRGPTALGAPSLRAKILRDRRAPGREMRAGGLVARAAIRGL
jgi:hypothetical protein